MSLDMPHTLKITKLPDNFCTFASQLTNCSTPMQTKPVAPTQDELLFNRLSKRNTPSPMNINNLDLVLDNLMEAPRRDEVDLPHDPVLVSPEKAVHPQNNKARKSPGAKKRRNSCIPAARPGTPDLVKKPKRLWMKEHAEELHMIASDCSGEIDTNKEASDPLSVQPVENSPELIIIKRLPLARCKTRLRSINTIPLHIRDVNVASIAQSKRLNDSKDFLSTPKRRKTVDDIGNNKPSEAAGELSSRTQSEQPETWKTYEQVTVKTPKSDLIVSDQPSTTMKISPKSQMQPKKKLGRPCSSKPKEQLKIKKGRSIRAPNSSEKSVKSMKKQDHVFLSDSSSAASQIQPFAVVTVPNDVVSQKEIVQNGNSEVVTPDNLRSTILKAPGSSEVPENQPVMVDHLQECLSDSSDSRPLKPCLKKKSMFQASEAIVVDSRSGGASSRELSAEEVEARETSRRALNKIRTLFEEKSKKASQKSPKKSVIKLKNVKQKTGRKSFAADNDSFDRVIYDPKDRGCLRDGLRVRKYTRPWWIHDGSEMNMGIIFNTITAKDVKLDNNFKKQMIKSHITEKQLMPTFLDKWLQPAEKIKKLELLRKSRFLQPSSSSFSF